MRTLRFGRTGVEVPVVSLGTWSYGGPNKAGEIDVGWSGHDDARARAALIRCHELGITHWDTADVYGDGRSEQLIGTVWDAVPREAIFLASKVGWDPGPYDHYYHPDQVRARIARSLENLRTEWIDLFYLHHCDFGPEGEWLDDALAAIHEARDAGRIRHVGLSDWDCGRIMQHIAKVDPDAVQPYRNVANDRYASSGLKAWVEEHDLGVAFFSPIRHGLLLGKYAEPTSFPAGDFRRNVKGFGDAELLATLAAKRDALRGRFPEAREPVLQGLLGALSQDAPTGCVLLGMRNPTQVAAGAAAGAALSAEDAAWVRELYADVEV